MNNELIHQYGHTWRVFERLVKDFDPEAWLHTGRGAITPVRLAFHILQSTRYYIQDSSALAFASGKSFEGNWATVAEEDLPSQNDIVEAIGVLQSRSDQWLSAMDLSAENTAFTWAGKTKLGVAIFLLRHSLFHIGELSSLLNESKNGAVEDHYVKAI